MTRRPPGAGGAVYRSWFTHVLSRVEAERAHQMATAAIATVGRIGPARAGLSAVMKGTGRRHGRQLPVLFGRTLTGPLGLAAGFDKNARMVPGLAALGFGFVEIGTVTAHAQPGNERPRLWRVTDEAALVNRMGFNNDGAAAVALRLRRLRQTPAGRRVVLGVNIGKSKRTPAAEAVADYTHSAQMLAPFADYLVVNVSSPNTPGLRDLQQVETLRPIAAAVRSAAEAAALEPVPVLVKIAPDLTDADIDAVAQLVRELGLAGVVGINTTTRHDHGPGGLSGPALRQRGLAVVSRLRRHLEPPHVIIGVGGISSPPDARAYLRAGADVVQAYAGFVYGGPTWPGRMNQALLRPDTPRA